MGAEVTALAGAKVRQEPNRTAVRHGHERGSVTQGRRRMPVRRPQVGVADGSGKLPVATL
jgi:putative transposase